MFKFPYTNLHELNLDWILEKVKMLVENNDEFNDKADYAVETADEAKEIAEQAASATIPDGSITTSKLADYAVTQVKLAVNAVGNYQLQDASVTNSKIYDGAVTTVKLADDAITSSKIKNGELTQDKYADDSITNMKLAPSIKTQRGTIAANDTTVIDITYSKTLLTTHETDTDLRGIYFCTQSNVIPVISAPGLTFSMNNFQISITNSTTHTARYIFMA